MAWTSDRDAHAAFGRRPQTYRLYVRPATPKLEWSGDRRLGLEFTA